MANNGSVFDNSLKTIVRTLPIIILGLILSKVFTYAYKILIARYFGPEVYGLFSLSLMILGFFVAVFGLGLPEGILRYISVYRGKNEMHKAKYILRLSNYVLLITGIISAIILFAMSGIISEKIFHSEKLIIFLKISSLIIPFYIFSSLYLSVIRAFEKLGWYSFIMNILQNIVKIAGLILLIVIGFKSSQLMYSFFLGILSMFIVSYYICKYKLSGIFSISKIDNKDKKQVNKELFNYSLPLMFSNILIIVYYWIDSFMIGYFKDAASVGFYSAAFTIALLFTIAQDLFIQITYPIINKEYARKKLDVVKELSKQIGKWIFIVNLPIFVIIFLFPGAVINIFFGPEYLAAAASLRVLSLGAFISTWAVLLSANILMAGKSKFILYNFIITSSLNIILDIILVPRIGIIGAAIATAIVWSVFTIILFIEVKSLLGFIPIRKKILKIFAVSLIPIALLVIIRKYIAINIINLILLGMSFLLLYFFLIMATKCLDRNDIMILKSFKERFFNKNRRQKKI